MASLANEKDLTFYSESMSWLSYYQSIGDNINIECCNLKYNRNFRMLLERTENFQPQTNSEFLTYTQLVDSLEKTKQQFNELIVNTLNLTKNNLNLKNKCDDYQRLLHCLATENISRLTSILNTCMNQKVSLNAILELIGKALNKFYSCKSFTQKEIDVGILVNAIGGPRLVFALNQLGFI